MSGILSKVGTSGASIVSGLAIVLLPKCPVCAAAYLSFLSSFGVDQWAPEFLWPVAYSLFGLSVALLGVRAWRRSDYRPFVIAVLGAGALLAAQTFEPVSILMWPGFALFIAGGIWSAQRSAGHAACQPAAGANRVVTS